jgi:hypothetical protein
MYARLRAWWRTASSSKFRGVPVPCSRKPSDNWGDGSGTGTGGTTEDIGSLTTGSPTHEMKRTWTATVRKCTPLMVRTTCWCWNGCKRMIYVLHSWVCSTLLGYNYKLVTVTFWVETWYCFAPPPPLIGLTVRDIFSKYSLYLKSLYETICRHLKKCI